MAERREAVLSLIRRDEPAAAIARRFGVSEQSIYRWRDYSLGGAGKADWFVQVLTEIGTGSIGTSLTSRLPPGLARHP